MFACFLESNEFYGKKCHNSYRVVSSDYKNGSFVPPTTYTTASIIEQRSHKRSSRAGHSEKLVGILEEKAKQITFCEKYSIHKTIFGKNTSIHLPLYS